MNDIMQSKNEEVVPVHAGLSIFDSGMFHKMGIIAAKLADSPILPESLRGTRKGQVFTPFEPVQVASNCFRLVEQASRWNISPFAVMDCASVIHGKLMWEGKVISSAISSLLGIRLNYTYSGSGLDRKVIVSGRFPDESDDRTIEGTVKDWKTDQWKASAYDQRLAYRGAREWARRHAPEVILGVYSPDEFDKESLVNITNGRGPAIRPEPLNPGASADKKQSLKVAPPEPNAQTIEPKGRQKKKRHQRDGVLKDISKGEPESGKPFWLIIIDVGKTTAKLRTFSTTMAERLGGLIGDTMRVTFTQGAHGTFDLEDFELMQSEVEGSLV